MTTSSSSPAPVRVHELAKKAGLKSTELIDKLKDLGISVKSHMSVLDDEAVKLIEKKLKLGHAETKHAPEHKEKAKAPASSSRARSGEKAEVKHAAAPKAEEKKAHHEAAKPSAHKAHAPAAEAPKSHETKHPAPHKAEEKKAHHEAAKPSAHKAEVKHAAHEPAHAKAAHAEEKPAAAGHKAHTPAAEPHKTHEVRHPAPHKAEEKKAPESPAPKAEEKAPAPEPAAAPDAKAIHVNKPIMLRDLAEKMALKPQDIIKVLMGHGVFASINQILDLTTVDMVAKDLGFKFDKDVAVKKPVVEAPPPPKEVMKPRPPVVTIMGHVDHGKTSLLDYIKKTQVAAREFGGITQHIGAYNVKTPRGTIVFMDTPGHEAFTALRARGANLTDICVLVVAADDGVMQQTVEAYNHAKAAGVPVMVAINKIDRPGANADVVKKQLLNLGLVPEDMGGETICCPVSALTGEGVDHLIEMILLQAELLELKGAPDRPVAKAVVVESKLCKGQGPVVTLIVREGTLKLGAPVVCDIFSGKIRSMKDPGGADIREAGPSTPIEISGLSGVPDPGSVLETVSDERAAKAVAEERALTRRQTALTENRAPLTWQEQMRQQAELKEVRLIVKADVLGSLEAIVSSLEQLSTETVQIKLIHKGVGDIVESDIMLASASSAAIIGFNVRFDNRIRDLAKLHRVDLRLYRIIYDLLDDIKKIATGMIEPEAVETVLGRVEVRQLFNLSKAGNVLGCYVVSGKVTRRSRIRVLRKGEAIMTVKIASLKRFKEEVREVASGFECGIKLENFNEVEVGDVLEAFIIEAKAAEASTEPAR